MEADQFIQLAECVNVLLKPWGDRQVVRLNDVPIVCAGDCLATNEEIVDLLVDEVAVAPQILLVDVKARGAARKKRSNCVMPITVTPATPDGRFTPRHLLPPLSVMP